MAVYVLDNDEAVIIKLSDAHLGSGINTVDLILTNKNIIQVNKGFFGGEKDSIKYPLTDLKNLNGKPNVRVGKSRSGKKQLELYFFNHEIAYTLPGYFKENSWVSAITKAYKKRISDLEKSNKSGKDSLLGAIKGKIAGNKPLPQKTCKCPKCGAELFGVKGEDVKCAYCDAIVRIK